eukprot:SAG11_NODE_1900_length_4091_cov_2.418838_5_plen_38_part_00
MMVSTDVGRGGRVEWGLAVGPELRPEMTRAGTETALV